MGSLSERCHLLLLSVCCGTRRSILVLLLCRSIFIKHSIVAESAPCSNVCSLFLSARAVLSTPVLASTGRNVKWGFVSSVSPGSNLYSAFLSYHTTSLLRWQATVHTKPSSDNGGGMLSCQPRTVRHKYCVVLTLTYHWAGYTFSGRLLRVDEILLAQMR